MLLKKTIFKSFFFLFLLLPNLFTAGRLNGKEGYYFMADANMSPYAGTYDLLSFYSAYENLEAKMLHKRSPNALVGNSGKAVISRSLNMLLLRGPLNEVALVMQHEIFGHGYRIRDLGPKRIHDIGYHVALPFPYGKGGGATGYNWTAPDWSTHEDILLSIGGFDASDIFAHTLQMHCLKRSHIKGREASLYLHNRLDSLTYLSTLGPCLWQEKWSSRRNGNDVYDAFMALTRTYDLNAVQFYWEYRKIRHLKHISMLDPFIYYGFYAWWHYIFTGKDFYFPMIPIGSLRYLPGVRMNLTPFGPDVRLDHFFVKDHKTFNVYMKYGRFYRNRYYGAGIEAPELYSFHKCNIGINADLWRQPPLFLAEEGIPYPVPENEGSLAAFREKVKNSKDRFGISGAVVLSYDLSNYSLYAELGGKTKGYVPGQSIFGGPIVRLGIKSMF